jgi:aldehyde:ferredoxin oxidoreductase
MHSPEGTIETRDYFNTKVIEKADAERILDDYYDERGWDIDNGTPTQGKLKELGLERYSN